MEYLCECKANSVAVVTGFHIVEHFPFKTLIRIFVEAFRVLKPGGMVIFETPNPENLIVGSCNFWYDPTHVKPLPGPMLKYIAEFHGFQRVETLKLHPYPEQFKFPDSPLGKRLDDYFHSAQDYALIGYKSQ